MKTSPLKIAMACLCSLSFLLVSCEGDSNHKDNSLYSIEDISGNWFGEYGRPENRTTLALKQSGTKLSGSVLLNNTEKRSVSGSRAGNNVVLNVQGGDRWELIVKDEDDLDGFGIAKDGTRYEVDLDRR